MADKVKSVVGDIANPIGAIQGNAKGSLWDNLRNGAETTASLVGNYLLPGSSLVSDQLVSKNAQGNLSSPLGMIGQGATGLAGAGVGSSITGIPSASSMGAGWTNAGNAVGNAVGAGNIGTNIANGASNIGNSISSGVGNLFGSTPNAATPNGPLFASTASPTSASGFQGLDLSSLGGANNSGSTSPLFSSATDAASTAAKNSPSTLSSALKVIGTLGPLISALKPTTYPGTQTQAQLQAQLAQQAQQQQNNNTAFANSLNAKPLSRNPITTGIDYYNYGSRAEQPFYGNINPQATFPNTNGTVDANGNPISSAPVAYARGGKVDHLARGGSPMPMVHGLNNGPLGMTGIKGGARFDTGGVVKMADGGTPPVVAPLRAMYMPPEMNPHNPYLPAKNLVTGVTLPGSNGRQMLATGGQPGGGQTDDIPAQLSQGEFVMPADVVSSLGDGNTDAGAKQLTQMMHAVRKHKASKMGAGKLPPKAKSPMAYLGQQGA